MISKAYITACIFGLCSLKVYGHDEGIEQEGFKLLEEIDNQLEEGVDWGLIEKIELKAV
ncbi:hypothetical protein [Paenibacillus sp. A3]|uniref:hypothetical protein n=1 Tax=Paenibacillus sp. A3 TaxID=1337054 RepID=UPI0012FB0FED|nr:hypothetical protein [Paenibacillus sp. A3]